MATKNVKKIGKKSTTTRKVAKGASPKISKLPAKKRLAKKAPRRAATS